MACIKAASCARSASTSLLLNLACNNFWREQHNRDKSVKHPVNTVESERLLALSPLAILHDASRGMLLQMQCAVGKAISCVVDAVIT